MTRQKYWLLKLFFKIPDCSKGFVIVMKITESVFMPFYFTMCIRVCFVHSVSHSVSNQHLNCFFPNCPILISRYMMSHPFFPPSSHSVIPPLSLPQPWQAIIPIFCLSISLLLHLAGLMPRCGVSCEGWERSVVLSGRLHRAATAIKPSLCI